MIDWYALYITEELLQGSADGRSVSERIDELNELPQEERFAIEEATAYRHFALYHQLTGKIHADQLAEILTETSFLATGILPVKGQLGRIAPGSSEESRKQVSRFLEIFKKPRTQIHAIWDGQNWDSVSPDQWIIKVGGRYLPSSKFREADVWDSAQTEQIILGRLRGLDTSCYENIKYNYRQMREIRRGMERGADISAYTNFKLSEEAMLAARLTLTNRSNLSARAHILQMYDENNRFDEYQNEQLLCTRSELLNGLERSRGLDPDTDEYWRSLIETLSAEFSAQPDESLKNRLYPDDSSGTSPYSPAQWEQILLGYQSDVPFERYLQNSFSAEEMLQIRKSMESRRADDNAVISLNGSDYPSGDLAALLPEYLRDSRQTKVELILNNREILERVFV